MDEGVSAIPELLVRAEVVPDVGVVGLIFKIHQVDTLTLVYAVVRSKLRHKPFSETWTPPQPLTIMPMRRHAATRTGPIYLLHLIIHPPH